MNPEDLTNDFYTHCWKCKKKLDDVEFDIQECKQCEQKL